MIPRDWQTIRHSQAMHRNKKEMTIPQSGQQKSTRRLLQSGL